MPRYVKLFEQALSPEFCRDLIEKFEADQQVRPDPQPHYSTRSYLMLGESRSWMRTIQKVTELAEPLIASFFQLPEPYQATSDREWMNDGWVIARYRPGDACAFHDDAQTPVAPSNGLRLATLIFFLNTVEEGQGGELFFPCQDLKVQAREGRAVIFPAQVTHPHEVLPTAQVRYVLQTWIVDPDMVVVIRED